MPDDEQNRFGRSFGEGYSYVALGFSFAVAILAFGALGWVVDGWLGTRPWLALVGAGIGGVWRVLIFSLPRAARPQGGKPNPPPLFSGRGRWGSWWRSGGGG